jgi:hypothetical protein
MQNNKHNFPNKDFAFTIFDDTDGATAENIAPIYKLLDECGIKTTKSVWIYPPRGSFVGSECLLDEGYKRFILELKTKGFEIALHNVGDGRFTREEIISGFEIFKEILGQYPVVHTNHVSNPDNIYWWDKRFEWPINIFYKLIARRHDCYGGELLGELYWGDLARTHLRYIRNLTFNNINTLACDPRMPYFVESKKDASQYWFSSSDGHTVKEFIDLLSENNLERLVTERGASIVYTHFSSGFVENGVVHPEFERRIRKLAQLNGWFVPVSDLLDHLSIKGVDDPGYLYRLNTNVRWCFDRIQKKLKYGR